MLDALAVRDPEADVVTDAKGAPEPDPDLRDQRMCRCLTAGWAS